MTSENAKGAQQVHPLRMVDQLAGPITSEDTKLLRLLQVGRLTSRCPISAAMAAALAPLVFGEARS